MVALRSVRGWIAVLVLLPVLLLAARAGAEGLDDLKNTTPAERAAAQTAMMKEKLGLSAEQAPKVAAINEKYAAQMDPILKGSDGMFSKMRAMKEVVDRCHAANKPVTLCGELASQPIGALALVALGFRALSLTPSALGAVKAMLLELDAKKAAALLHPLVVKPGKGVSIRAKLEAFAEAEGLSL